MMQTCRSPATEASRGRTSSATSKACRQMRGRLRSMRGIWIIDDITPLRALTPELLAKEAAFVEARPNAQQVPAGGGWANGDAVFVGDNPTDEAVITYYQQKRHIFGDLKIEILDATGK